MSLYAELVVGGWLSRSEEASVVRSKGQGISSPGAARHWTADAVSASRSLAGSAIGRRQAVAGEEIGCQPHLVISSSEPRTLGSSTVARDGKLALLIWPPRRALPAWPLRTVAGLFRRQLPECRLYPCADVTSLPGGKTSYWSVLPKPETPPKTELHFGPTPHSHRYQSHTISPIAFLSFQNSAPADPFAKARTESKHPGLRQPRSIATRRSPGQFSSPLLCPCCMYGVHIHTTTSTPAVPLEGPTVLSWKTGAFDLSAGTRAAAVTRKSRI